MKTLYTRELKDGRRHVLIELRAGERRPIPAVDPDAFYKLSELHDEVFRGRVLENPTRVYWCSLGQKWEDA
jgi:hypothetical protein